MLGSPNQLRTVDWHEGNESCLLENERENTTRYNFWNNRRTSVVAGVSVGDEVSNDSFAYVLTEARTYIAI